jgi:hypothetical protein
MIQLETKCLDDHNAEHCDYVHPLNEVLRTATNQLTHIIAFHAIKSAWQRTDKSWQRAARLALSISKTSSSKLRLVNGHWLTRFLQNEQRRRLRLDITRSLSIMRRETRYSTFAFPRRHRPRRGKNHCHRDFGLRGDLGWRR